MSIASRNSKQDATHWVVTGSNGYGGFTFDTPVLVKCRWEDRTERFLNPQGDEVVSAAIVYPVEDVSVGDYMALGDLTATSDPITIAGTYPVRRFSKNTNLRNLEVIRKVYL
jgi:hypothetical protein